MLLSVQYGVGKFPDLENIAMKEGIPKAADTYRSFAVNLRGLAFLLSNAVSTSSATATVLQVPLQAPVMKRELASKMYTPSAYFFGRFFSNCIFQTLYPTIMTLCMFWHLEIDTSWENFRAFYSIGVISNFVFTGVGYFVGICITNENTALLVGMFVVSVFVATNGALTNLSS